MILFERGSGFGQLLLKFLLAALLVLQGWVLHQLLHESYWVNMLIRINVDVHAVVILVLVDRF